MNVYECISALNGPGVTKIDATGSHPRLAERVFELLEGGATRAIVAQVSFYYDADQLINILPEKYVVLSYRDIAARSHIVAIFEGELNEAAPSIDMAYNKKMFPLDLGKVQIKDLIITSEGARGMPLPADGRELIKVLKDLAARYFKAPLSSLTAVEVNAGLGGFTVRLAAFLKKVVAATNDAAALRNNTSIYRVPRSKLTIVEGEYPKNEGDIIIFNPFGLRKKGKVWRAVVDILEEGGAPVVILYCPSNFDLIDLAEGMADYADAVTTVKYDLPSGNYFLAFVAGKLTPVKNELKKPGRRNGHKIYRDV